MNRNLNSNTRKPEQDNTARFFVRLCKAFNATATAVSQVYSTVGQEKLPIIYANIRV